MRSRDEVHGVGHLEDAVPGAVALQVAPLVAHVAADPTPLASSSHSFSRRSSSGVALAATPPLRPAPRCRARGLLGAASPGAQAPAWRPQRRLRVRQRLRSGQRRAAARGLLPGLRFSGRSSSGVAPAATPPRPPALPRATRLCTCPARRCGRGADARLAVAAPSLCFVAGAVTRGGKRR
ncbi:hypothetical protein BDA96_10G007300 [Sorghum bicolor]|uniref:Uncharacterized protein n=1 Tax=Sorghum bicolor TaxID=4558 RepID=A0A921TXB6_SORBI|nr:hypothetical protein BDA96_10G007300 [Sorghum bicolor]